MRKTLTPSDMDSLLEDFRQTVNFYAETEMPGLFATDDQRDAARDSAAGAYWMLNFLALSDYLRVASDDLGIVIAQPAAEIDVRDIFFELHHADDGKASYAFDLGARWMLDRLARDDFLSVPDDSRDAVILSEEQSGILKTTIQEAGRDDAAPDAPPVPEALAARERQEARQLAERQRDEARDLCTAMNRTFAQDLSRLAAEQESAPPEKRNDSEADRLLDRQRCLVDLRMDKARALDELQREHARQASALKAGFMADRERYRRDAEAAARLRERMESSGALEKTRESRPRKY